MYRIGSNLQLGIRHLRTWWEIELEDFTAYAVSAMDHIWAERNRVRAGKDLRGVDY